MARKKIKPDLYPEAHRTLTGRMIPCPGEAHKMPWAYDHCMVCLGGTWGEVPETAPIDMEAARINGLDVPFPALESEQFAQAYRYEADGLAKVVSVHRNNSGYTVLLWKKD